MPRKKKVEKVNEIKIGDIVKANYDIVLRSDKNVSAPICQKINQKSDITIIGESADWYLVKYNTVCGYIPKSFIS